MLLGDVNIVRRMTHIIGLREISLGNSLRRIRSLGVGTMTILSKNQVVKIARRVCRSFQPQPLRQLVFNPPRIGKVMIHALSLREIFQSPRLTPLYLSVVRTN